MLRPSERNTKPAPTLERNIVAACQRALVKAGGDRILFSKHHGSAYSSAGVLDIFGCYRGQYFEIEIKRPGQKPTALQQKRIERVSAAGGIAIWTTTPQACTAMIADIDAMLDTNKYENWGPDT